jgi:hypothetical protein
MFKRNDLLKMTKNQTPPEHFHSAIVFPGLNRLAPVHGDGSVSFMEQSQAHQGADAPQPFRERIAAFLADWTTERWNATMKVGRVAHLLAVDRCLWSPVSVVTRAESCFSLSRKFSRENPWIRFLTASEIVGAFSQ